MFAYCFWNLLLGSTYLWWLNECISTTLPWSASQTQKSLLMGSMILILTNCHYQCQLPNQVPDASVKLPSVSGDQGPVLSLPPPFKICVHPWVKGGWMICTTFPSSASQTENNLLIESMILILTKCQSVKQFGPFNIRKVVRSIWKDPFDTMLIIVARLQNVNFVCSVCKNL